MHSPTALESNQSFETLVKVGDVAKIREIADVSLDRVEQRHCIGRWLKIGKHLVALPDLEEMMSERGGLNPQRSAERLPAPCSHDRASVSPSRGARLLTDIARMQR